MSNLSDLDKEFLKAASENDAAKVFHLKKLGANILAQEEHNGKTAAILLAECGNWKAVLRLAWLCSKVLKQADCRGNTAAILLAQHGVWEAVNELVFLCPEVLEQANDNGDTVAFQLAKCGDGEAVIRLASYHVAVKQETEVIAMAIATKNTALIAKLINAGFACPSTMDEQLNDVGLTLKDIVNAA